MKKQAKKTKSSFDCSNIIGKVISVGLVMIGLVIVALLVVILAKTMRDEDKYTISYHSDDKLASQIVEQSKLESSAIIDEDLEVINTDDYISVEKALEIALNGLSKDQVWDIDIELERKYGQIVYEVSYNSGQYEYEYYINAKSGEIIKSFKEVDR